MLFLTAATRKKRFPDGRLEQVPMADHFEPDREYDLENENDAERLLAEFVEKFELGPHAKGGWKLVGVVRFKSMSKQYCIALAEQADSKSLAEPNRPSLTLAKS